MNSVFPLNYTVVMHRIRPYAPIRALAFAQLAFALLALPVGCAPADTPLPGAPQVTRAVVARHTDGDTARMRLNGGGEERVRFIGIDTPEIGERSEPLGEEAAEYTAEAIPVGTTVWLQIDVEPRDRHGRLLAYVWLERPERGDADEARASMLNAQLLLDGYANTLTVPPNVQYAERFRAFQAEAREAGRGLWAED